MAGKMLLPSKQTLLWSVHSTVLFEGDSSPHAVLTNQQVGTQLWGAETSGLQHHLELVSGTPALVDPLGCLHHLPLQPTDLPPLVEGDHLDPSSWAISATP